MGNCVRCCMVNGCGTLNVKRMLQNFGGLADMSKDNDASYFKHIVSILERDPYHLWQKCDGISTGALLAIMGGAVFAGGLRFKPVVLGGLASFVYGGIVKKHGFQSLIEVVQNLNNAQKSRLVRMVRGCVGKESESDLDAFLESQEENRHMFLYTLVAFSKCNLAVRARL